MVSLIPPPPLLYISRLWIQPQLWIHAHMHVPKSVHAYMHEVPNHTNPSRTCACWIGITTIHLAHVCELIIVSESTILIARVHPRAKCNFPFSDIAKHEHIQNQNCRIHGIHTQARV